MEIELYGTSKLYYKRRKSFNGFRKLEETYTGDVIVDVKSVNNRRQIEDIIHLKF